MLGGDPYLLKRVQHYWDYIRIMAKKMETTVVDQVD